MHRVAIGVGVERLLVVESVEEGGPGEFVALSKRKGDRGSAMVSG